MSGCLAGGVAACCGRGSVLVAYFVCEVERVRRVWRGRRVAVGTARGGDGGGEGLTTFEVVLSVTWMW